MRSKSTRQRRADQHRGLVASKERRKGSKTRTLRLPERDLVNRLEPISQRFEAMRLTDFIDNVLYRLGVTFGRHVLERICKRAQRFALLLGRCAITLLRVDKVFVVFQRIADQP